MNIVCLVPKSLYDSKMSRVRFQQWAAIAKIVPLHVTGLGWPDWDDTLSPGKNLARIPVGDPAHPRPAELVISYKAGVLHDVVQPVVVQFNEADDHEKTLQEIYDARAQLIVFHHENDMPQYAHLLTREHAAFVRRLVHIQHCADTSVYKDYGLPKDIDVLCAGNLSQQFYPFRYRLMRLAWTILRRRGHVVKVLRHPGYTLPPREGTVIGDDFARMLNRSKLVFTCSMRYKYALAKYSEIALCRSLAVGDVPNEREAFFRQSIVVVEPYMTDEEIVRIVEEYLDDDDKRKSLTDTAYDLNLQSSTMAHYAENFLREARLR